MSGRDEDGVFAPPATSVLTSRHVDIGGLTLHARVSSWGDARRNVVLVHGLVSSRYLVRTARRLTPGIRVVAPDLPEFGRSPKSTRALDVAGLTNALAAFIVGEGLVDAMIVGHSVGAQVVVDLAGRHPHLVERAVLAAPTFDPAARTMRQQYARWVRNVVREPVSLNALLAREAVELGPVRPVRVLRSALRDRIEDKLHRVKVPTLVVRGELDALVPQGWCEHVAALLPAGRLAVIPGAPHTVTYNAPRQFAALLREFWAEGGH